MVLPLALDPTWPWSASCPSWYKEPAFLCWTKIPFKNENIQTIQYLEESIGYAMDVTAQIREISLNPDTLSNED